MYVVQLIFQCRDVINQHEDQLVEQLLHQAPELVLKHHVQLDAVVQNLMYSYEFQARSFLI